MIQRCLVCTTWLLLIAPEITCCCCAVLLLLLCQVLLEMVAEPAPCQGHAALVLQVVTSNDDEAMAELAELDLQPLLQVCPPCYFICSTHVAPQQSLCVTVPATICQT